MVPHDWAILPNVCINGLQHFLHRHMPHYLLQTSSLLSGGKLSLGVELLVVFDGSDLRFATLALSLLFAALVAGGCNLLHSSLVFFTVLRKYRILLFPHIMVVQTS